MQIVKVKTSSEKQTKDLIKWYGNEVHVHFPKGVETREDEDGVEVPEYVYDKVIIENGKAYTDVQAAAQNFYSKVTKAKNLENCIVTTSTGKRIYADPASRTDITDAINIAIETGETSVNWKTADGWIEVTLDEMKEARLLALQKKEEIISI